MIFIKDLKECRYFQAGDRSILCELIHPDREGVALHMGFSLAHAIVKPGESTLPHKLKTSSEIYYILEGEGIIHIGNDRAAVRMGQAVYIPPDARQFIRNTGQTDLTFLCLVSPQWKEGDEVLG